MKKFFNSIFRKHERGNIATVLFGSVAMVGVISAATMQMISGPIRTASEVNNKNLVEAQLITATRVIVLDASSTDIDTDGTIEPPAYGASIGLTGGGAIPTSIGAPKTDPWNTSYGYCAWDNGTDFTAAGNRLNGENSSTAKAIALISAGPDRVFQTSCNAYPTANPVNKPAGSDDFVFDFTYAEAAAAGGGLWQTGTATPQNEVVVKDSGGSETVVVNKETGIGDFFGLVTDVITAKTGNSLSIENDADGELGFAHITAANYDIQRLTLNTENDVTTPEIYLRAINAGVNKNQILSNNPLQIATNGAAHGIHFGRQHSYDSPGVISLTNEDLTIEGGTGDVGINNASPIVKLDVTGSIKVGDGGETCSGGETAFPGTMRYNTASDTIEFCQDNGGSADAWKNVLSSPGYWTQTGSIIYYNTGGVAIGATSPGSNELLVSNGTDYVPNTNANSAIRTQGSHGGGILMQDGTKYGGMYMVNSGADMRFNLKGTAASNVDVMTLNENGNVAIGNAAGSSKLLIDQNNNATGLEVFGGNSGALLARFTRDLGGDGETIQINPANGDIVMEILAGTTATGWNIGVDDSDGDRFSIYSGTAFPNTTDEFTIETNGNVGIGTVAPNRKLDVGGTAPIISLSHAGSVGMQLIDWSDGNQYIDFDGNFYLRDGIDGSGTTSPITILKGGGIGIKTTTPTYILDVAAASNTDGIGLNDKLAISSNDGWLRLNQKSEFTNGIYTPGNLRVDGAYYFNNDRYLDTPTGDYGTIQVNGTGTGGWQGYSIAGRTVFMHDGSNGTGIYDDVNNQWMFYGILNGEARMYHAGTWRIRTTSTGAQINSQLLLSSDKRRKENIKTLDNSLEKISKIRGVSFDWKDKKERGDQTQYGVIAQEVQEVFPELVVKEDNSDYLTVNYQGMIGPLIEAVKELKAENEDLKKRLEALEK